MKVKMKQTVKGSPNGIDVQTYESGQIYDIPEKLANIFYSMKAAEIIPFEEPKMESKNAPNNKIEKADDEEVKDKKKKKEEKETK